MIKTTSIFMTKIMNTILIVNNDNNYEACNITLFKLCRFHNFIKLLILQISMSNISSLKKDIEKMELIF